MDELNQIILYTTYIKWAICCTTSVGTSENPQMKQMMYIFPLMMIFISYKMPAGLQFIG